MTHAEMDELYDLYALGALEGELAAEIETHLTDQCPHCQERVRDAVRLTAALAGIAEPVKVPGGLRSKVLAGVIPPKRSQSWMFAVAALSAACIALLVLMLLSRSELGRVSNQLATLRAERDELRSALEIMSRSETRSVQFGRADNFPHGRVFLNRNGGLVFVGSQLPQLAADRTFELWLIPQSGAPRPAGLFRPNATGDSVNVSQIAVDPSETKAVAVSVEPLAGSTAPTTTPILVVPLA
jgi:anti-sigma-K factor RskA